MILTLATIEQIKGDKALGVIKTYGSKTGLSDLAIILGAACSSRDTDIDGNLAGWAWTSSVFHEQDVCIQGGINTTASEPCVRSYAIRPVIPPSQTQKILPSRVIFYPEELPNGKTILVAKFGEFPQTVANKRTSSLLELALEEGTLIKTGKIYTFDGTKLEDFQHPFTPLERLEYQFQNARYVRVKAQPKDNRSILSNGELVQEDRYYWVKVQPVEWLVDMTGYWISKTALISGIQFDPTEKYHGCFPLTQMNMYLKNHVSEEILPLRQPVNQQIIFLTNYKYKMDFIPENQRAE